MGVEARVSLAVPLELSAWIVRLSSSLGSVAGMTVVGVVCWVGFEGRGLASFLFFCWLLSKKITRMAPMSRSMATMSQM